MKSALFLGLVLLATLPFVIAEEPPSLTDFHQFYGEVRGLPEGTFAVKAIVSGNVFTTSISVDGKYGYSPALFKVSGEEGARVSFFIVSQLGTAVQAGTATYTSGFITQQDLQYPVAPAPEGNEEEQVGSPASQALSQTQQNAAPTAGQEGSSATCTQSWSCTEWSSCTNGLQARTCSRSDSCDQQQAEGRVATIIPLPTPSIQQACAAGSPAGVTACSPATKRCVGKELQQCASDGSGWDTEEACGRSCNPSTLSCDETTPILQQLSLSYILGGLVLLIIIAGGLAIIFHHRKYGPLQQYIAESRAHGYSDMQIRSKLSQQGWDDSRIRSLLK